MNTSQRAGIVAGVVATTLILGGCATADPDSGASADASGSQPQDVRMAIQPWIGYGQWYVAEEEGFFADNDLDVEMTSFNTDADLSAAFASGSVDVANVATHTAMILIESGVPIKVVLVEDVSTTADAILAGNGIESVEDLRGKSVAYEQGTTSDLLLNYALDSVGLTLADITPVPLPASNAGAALIAGQVDAAVTYEPYITTATQDSSEVRVLYTAGEEPGLISDVLIVSDTFAADHPDAVRGLVNAWGQSVDFYNENTDEARAIIAAGVGEDAEALATAFDGVQYYDLEDNRSELSGAFVEDTLPVVLKAAQNAGIITGEVDLSSVIDAQFIEN